MDENYKDNIAKAEATIKKAESTQTLAVKHKGAA